LESNKLYKEIGVKEGLSFDQSPSGILHFYKDPVYFENAKQAQSIYQNNGVAWDILTPMKTLSLDKTLGDVQGIVGGAWTWHDWTGDIHKFCYQLSKILETKYNVKFKFNESISTSYDLEVLEDCFDTIVVSAGVGSERLANKVGDRLDVYPVKGYSVTIHNVDKKYLPTVSLLDDQAKIVTSTLGNRFRVAGTAELAGENYDIRKDRIQPLLDWIHTNFPNINTHDYSSWACLRPMTPNMMPIVRQSKKNTKIFYHTGHGHLGWTLSPATAKQLAELVK
jgi:D-amino-acid dehydrogenase